MVRLPASLQPKSPHKLTESRKQAWRGALHMDKPLTPNMLRCLQHMDVEGGNAVTYRAGDLVVSTGLTKRAVTQALDALYVRSKVERIDTGDAIYWRKGSPSPTNGEQG